jgi:hypothetical protein
MKIADVEKLFESGHLDDDYMDFLMKRVSKFREVFNKDYLLDAFEDGYKLDEFLTYYAKSN